MHYNNFNFARYAQKTKLAERPEYWFQSDCLPRTKTHILGSCDHRIQILSFKGHVYFHLWQSESNFYNIEKVLLDLDESN